MSHRTIRRVAGPALVTGLVGTQLTGASSAHAAPPRLIRVSAQSASNAAGAKSVAAHCPTDRVLVGGGAEVVGGNGRVLLTKMVPNMPTGAYEAAANADYWGYHKKWQLKAYAICSTPVYSTLQLVTTQFLPAKSSIQVMRAGCPENTSPLSAGVAAVGANGRVYPIFGVDGDVVIGGGVVASGGYDKRWALTTYTVCAYTVGALTQVLNQSPDDANPIKSVTLTCPARTKVVGLSYDLTAQAKATSLQESRSAASVLGAGPGLNATRAAKPVSQYAFAVPESVMPSADLSSATIRLRVGKAGFRGTWQLFTNAICTD